MGSQNKRRVVFADDDARPCPKDLGHKFGRTPRDHLSIPPHESINERTILELSLSLRVAAPPPAAFVPSTVTVSRVFTTCKPVRACTIKRIDTSVDIGRGATVWLGETTLCGALFSCLEESGPDGRRAFFRIFWCGDFAYRKVKVIVHLEPDAFPAPSSYDDPVTRNEADEFLRLKC